MTESSRPAGTVPGLRLDRYLTEDRGWLRAVPANPT